MIIMAQTDWILNICANCTRLSFSTVVMKSPPVILSVVLIIAQV
jgi:hypothetical protein